MKAEIPFHIKLILILATILFLLIVDPFGGERKGKLENDFDTWLNASIEMLMQPKAGEQPAVEILLRSEAPSRRFTWELKATDKASANEPVVRLLRQAREAGLFAFASERPGEMTLEVKSPPHVFVSRFNSSDIRNNVKATIFLQLFQEYAASKENEGKKDRGES